jgi:hypothetical protein
MNLLPTISEPSSNPSYPSCDQAIHFLARVILTRIQLARTQDEEAKHWLLENGYGFLQSLIHKEVEYDHWFHWVTSNCQGKLKMAKSWIIVKHEILEKRGYVCECCGLPNQFLQAHHVFIHRMKGHPELDVEENAQLVCNDCHYITGKANSRENFEDFWDIQSERYDMDAWKESLPLKVKLMYTP